VQGRTFFFPGAQNLEGFGAIGSKLAIGFCDTAGKGEAQFWSEELLDVGPAYVGCFLDFLDAQDL